MIGLPTAVINCIKAYRTWIYLRDVLERTPRKTMARVEAKYLFDQADRTYRARRIGLHYPLEQELFRLWLHQNEVDHV